jgi:hypothetical protein
MNTFPQFVIFSAERSDRSPELNAIYTAQLSEQLAWRGLYHYRVIGSYKGAQENSFVVYAEPDDILTLAKRYGQESVLAVDSARLATLIYVDSGKHEPLGVFGQIDADYAKTLDAWTLTPDGTYYAVL